MDTTSPARLARTKRLSHDEDEPALHAAKDWFSAHKGVLAATFVVSWIWFARVLTPAMLVVNPPAASPDPLHPPPKFFGSMGLILATGAPLVNLEHLTTSQRAAVRAPSMAVPSEPKAMTTAHVAGLMLATGSPTMLHLARDGAASARQQPSAVAARSKAAPSGASQLPFVLTCSLVHTLLVCLGLACGSDTASGRSGGVSSTLFKTGLVAFGLLCACLYAAWEFQVGPVPAFAADHFCLSEAAFVLSGAASATAWLTLPMLLEHSRVGRAWLSSPRSALFTSVAGGMLLAIDQLSLSLTLGCFGLIVGGSLVAANKSTVVPRSSTAGKWNL